MRTIADILDKHVFRRTTLTEQASHTIRTHEFTLHMARARIAALESWNAAHAHAALGRPD